MRLQLPILAVLTDRTLLSPNWTLAQAIAPAITGGANLIIFRESDLPDTPRLSVARFIHDGVRGQVPWIASGSPEFALRAGANGVLLESESDSVARAREVFGSDAIVGTIVTLPEQWQAEADFGLAIFDWENQDKAIELIERLSPAGKLVAGIDPPLESVPRIMAAGAAGIAVCEAAMSAYNRTQALAAYRTALEA